MLCEGCHSILKVTSSVNSHPTAFPTSYQRIKDCAELAEYGHCFLCAAILKEIKCSSSTFHPIFKDVLRAEEEYREEQPLWLLYSVGFDFRPLQNGLYTFDTVFRVRWRFGHAKVADGTLTFYFSPIHRDQTRDLSMLFKDSETSKPFPKMIVGRPWRLTRRLHSPACRECHSMDLSKAEYGKSESDEEFEEGEEEVYHTTMRDGFELFSKPNADFQCDNTGSAECVALIARWMDICESQHSRCPKRSFGPGEQTIYPTRLLDLGPSGQLDADLRLIISNEMAIEERYMTLSHCWGNYDHIKLTSENLDEFKREIKFKNLSKTFQDSVMVTRRLGIRLLWIDSLCIIQSGKGSEDDWHFESARMHKVYKHSFLNIGATSAVDGRHGCFQPREYSEIFRPILTKPECWTHFQDWRQPYRLVETSFLDDQLLQEPLLQRGWVFQERWLSRRMLHFGSKQLFWECREWQACESFPEYLMPPVMMASLNELEARKRQSEENARKREAKEERSREKRSRQQKTGIKTTEIVDNVKLREEDEDVTTSNSEESTRKQNVDCADADVEAGAEIDTDEETGFLWSVDQLNMWAKLINVESFEGRSVRISMKKRETAGDGSDSDSDSDEESSEESADGEAREKAQKIETLVRQADVHSQWHQIVLEYTSKQISRKEDKLVALSGVAREYAELDLKDDNRYWAGIWACDVPRGLLWYTDYRKSRRASSWCAPTWSWASIEGAVDEPIASVVSVLKPGILELTKVMDMEAKYVMEGNAFGAIKSGRIRMKGKILEVQAMMSEDDNFVLLSQGYEIEGSAWYPDEAPSEAEKAILCLAFFSGSEGLYGMTIAKAGERDDEYIRTGVFSIVGTDRDTGRLPRDWVPPFPPFWDLRQFEDGIENEDWELFYLV